MADLDRNYFRNAPRADAHSLPPPTLCERRHCGLGRRLIAVRRRPVLVVPEGQCPHPRHAD
jgi:hypothetical protein